MHPGQRKKLLLRSRLSDVFSRRNALRTIICLLDVLKKDFGEVDVLSRRIALRTIKCLLDVLKKDFGEADEATFRDFERQFQIIFCIVGIEKSDFYDVT
jgi:hypothetical protein